MQFTLTYYTAQFRRTNWCHKKHGLQCRSLVFQILFASEIWGARVSEIGLSRSNLGYSVINEIDDEKVCRWYSASFFLHLLPIRFAWRNLFCNSNFTMKHWQKPDWKSNLLWFSCDYRKCMFADSLIGIHMFLWLCSLLCRVVDNT